LKRLVRRGVAFEGLVNFIPEIVTSDADMAPWDRRDLGKKAVRDLDALLTDEGDGPAQIELAPGLLTLGVELGDDRIDADLLGDGVDHGSRQNLADLQRATQVADERQLDRKAEAVVRTPVPPGQGDILRLRHLPMIGIATQAPTDELFYPHSRYSGNRQSRLR
jgi:hypothetical protein